MRNIKKLKFKVIIQAIGHRIEYNIVKIMGQQQSVDLQEFETKQQINNFINSTNEDNIRLEQKADKILEEINKREVNPQLTKVVDAYFRADCECNAPPFVFWLSSKKRQECQNAKMEAFNQISDLCMRQLEKQELNGIHDELIKQTNMLAKISIVNSKYTNKS